MPTTCFHPGDLITYVDSNNNQPVGVVLSSHTAAFCMKIGRSTYQYYKCSIPEHAQRFTGSIHFEIQLFLLGAATASDLHLDPSNFDHQG